MFSDKRWEVGKGGVWQEVLAEAAAKKWPPPTKRPDKADHANKGDAERQDEQIRMVAGGESELFAFEGESRGLGRLPVLSGVRRPEPFLHGT